MKTRTHEALEKVESEIESAEREINRLHQRICELKRERCEVCPHPSVNVERHPWGKSECYICGSKWDTRPEEGAPTYGNETAKA